MRNKTFISIWINILIGILFSFPVFSAQNPAIADLISKYECNVSDNELRINYIAGSIDKLKKDYLKRKNLSKTVSKKSLTLKTNSISLYSYKNLIHLYSDLTFPYKNNLYPTFVDISYLKELRTIKMLS